MKPLIALVLLTACSDSGVTANPVADAVPERDGHVGSTTSCGAPLATEAPATVQVTGRVASGTLSTGGTGEVGATVDVLRIGSDASLGTATTGSDGAYSVDATTANAAIDGYLRIRKVGRVESRFFSKAPIGDDVAMRTALLFDANTRDLLFSAAGVPRDPDKGVAIVFVNDCQDAGQDGMTITVSPAGSSTVKYFSMDGGSSGTTTDGLGAAMILNAEPGELVVGARFGALEMHEHVVTAGPDHVSLVEVAPR